MCTEFHQIVFMHQLRWLHIFFFAFNLLMLLVIKLHPTLWDLKDCNLPGSSVHGVSQARILEWIVFLFPEDLPNPGVKTASPTWQANSLPLIHLGSPNFDTVIYINKHYDLKQILHSWGKSSIQYFKTQFGLLILHLWSFAYISVGVIYKFSLHVLSSDSEMDWVLTSYKNLGSSFSFFYSEAICKTHILFVPW